MSYKVGQVVYIILNKRQTVLPAQVVEETVRRTLNGEEVTYSVRVPNNTKKTYALAELDGDVYSSLGDVREKLVSNATAVIDDLINNARSAESNHFGPPPEPSPHAATPNGVDESVTHKITLEDGTVANVKMPSPGGVS